MNEYLKASGVG